MRIAALLFALFPLPAFASMWVDPDWKTMITESDLIVLAEVTSGGAFEATVSVKTTFLGTAPAEPLTVGGFNNHHWPKDAVEEESFKDGESYYLFLRKVEPDGVADARDAKLRDLAAAGRLYVVWTPTAGDLPVAGGKVRFALTGTGYSLHKEGRAVPQFERFLRAAISAGSGTRDAAFIAEKQAELLKADIASAAYAEMLLAYEYTGGTDLLPSFAGVAKDGTPDAQLSVARIAGQTGGDAGWTLLTKLLDARDGAVQGEAVRQLIAAFPAKAAPVLLSRLDTASTKGRGPRSLMDPVRNEMASGQFEIIVALGKLKYAPAEKPLLSLLSSADGRSAKVILAALEALGSTGHVQALERRLDTDDLELEDPTLATIAKQKLIALRPAVEKYLLRAKTSWDRTDAADTLAALGDPRSAAPIQTLLDRMVTHAPGTHDSKEAANLLEALAKLHAKTARPSVESVAAWWLGVHAGDDAASLRERQALAADLVARAKAALAEHTVHEVRARHLDGAVLLHVVLDGDGEPEAIQDSLAKTLGIPEERVGVVVRHTRSFSSTAGDDDRFDEHDTQVVMRGLCAWISAMPDATPRDWPRLLEEAAGTTCKESEGSY